MCREEAVAEGIHARQGLERNVEHHSPSEKTVKGAERDEASDLSRSARCQKLEEVQVA